MVAILSQPQCVNQVRLLLTTMSEDYLPNCKLCSWETLLMINRDFYIKNFRCKLVSFFFWLWVYDKTRIITSKFVDVGLFIFMCCGFFLHGNWWRQWSAVFDEWFKIHNWVDYDKHNFDKDVFENLFMDQDKTHCGPHGERDLGQLWPV